MMRGFPTGVAVVAACDHTGQPRGMTCSSVCSVALDPPTLLVCLRSGSPTLAAVTDRGLFTVNLLHERAQSTAESFASGQPDRFDRTDWEAGAAGPRLLADSHAVADCRVADTRGIGDHVVVFGEVEHVTWDEDCHPLLYGLRRYGRWGDSR
ncbi:flavin reductase family protein [Amycolatopsis sp. 195334CR]|nr:flavin reductase family protein [Amycolatopsis sp. 195334CR]